MIQLIWITINTSLVVFFAYLLIGFFIRGKKIFPNRFKTISKVIFVLGIIQVLSGFYKKGKKTEIIRTKNTAVSCVANTKKIVLEDNLVLDIFIDLKFCKDQEKVILLESYCGIDGMTSGFSWNTIQVELINDEYNKPRYHVIGLLKWNLLGISWITEEKRFEGDFN